MLRSPQFFAPPVPTAAPDAAGLLEAVASWARAEADAVRFKAAPDAQTADAYRKELEKWAGNIDPGRSRWFARCSARASLRVSS